LAQNVQPQNLEFTLPGGRPRIRTSGEKSSVWQRSDRSLPRRRRRSITLYDDVSVFAFVQVLER